MNLLPLVSLQTGPSPLLQMTCTKQLKNSSLPSDFANVSMLSQVSTSPLPEFQSKHPRWHLHSNF